MREIEKRDGESARETPSSLQPDTAFEQRRGKAERAKSREGEQPTPRDPRRPGFNPITAGEMDESRQEACKSGTHASSQLNCRLT